MLWSFRSQVEPKLTKKRIAWLAKTVISENPAQLRFPVVLWIREIARELIKRRFRATMTLTSVGNLLRRFGFNVQRPLIRACERHREAAKCWLTLSSRKLGMSRVFDRSISQGRCGPSSGTFSSMGG
ncbi:MAG: helix-turn-helix domain-containing protein [Vulcanimicrobiaceae bacterium]